MDLCAPENLLARRANAEEFQLVGDGSKPIVGGDSFLEFAHRALIELDNSSAAGANEVMMMPIVAFLQQLETGSAIAEIKLLHHSHLLQQMNRSIDGGQVTLTLR